MDERVPRTDDANRADLFARAADGEERALGSLLESYLPRLRAYARQHTGGALRRRETSEDIVQSVFRQLVEKRSDLVFPDEAGLRGWLFRATRTKIREKGRHHGRSKRDVQREDADPPLADLPADGSSPSRVAMSRERIARFEAAFDTLSPDHREVIALARIAGLPYRVVGERMGRSVDAVRQLLGRALLVLDKRLAPADDAARDAERSDD